MLHPPTAVFTGRGTVANLGVFQPLMTHYSLNTKNTTSRPKADTVEGEKTVSLK